MQRQSAPQVTPDVSKIVCNIPDTRQRIGDISRFEASTVVIEWERAESLENREPVLMSSVRDFLLIEELRKVQRVTVQLRNKPEGNSDLFIH